jgi:hypothetical protein
MGHARGRDGSYLIGTTRLLKSPARIAHGELAVCYGGGARIELTALAHMSEKRGVSTESMGWRAHMSAHSHRLAGSTRSVEKGREGRGLCASWAEYGFRGPGEVSSLLFSFFYS